MKWIVEYTTRDKKTHEMRFHTREEAEKFIEQISNDCIDVRLRYDWTIIN